MIDDHVEDAIALDVASGLPSKLIVGKYNLASKHTLEQILEKEEVVELVQGYREYLAEHAAVNMAKRSIAADRIMDELIERAQDRYDKKSATIGMWLVDGTMPVKEQKHVHEHQIDGQVVVDFAAGVAKLRALQASRGADFSIEEGDRHLEFGKEHIEKRDQQLAAIGAGVTERD